MSWAYICMTHIVAAQVIYTERTLVPYGVFNMPIWSYPCLVEPRTYFVTYLPGTILSRQNTHPENAKYFNILSCTTFICTVRCIFKGPLQCLEKHTPFPRVSSINLYEGMNFPPLVCMQDVEANLLDVMFGTMSTYFVIPYLFVLGRYLVLTLTAYHRGSVFSRFAVHIHSNVAP